MDLALERISRNSASPSVVLPDPDSPTMPSVWPCRTGDVDAVHRLDVIHGAPQRPLLDREPDLEVAAAASPRARMAAPGGSPLGSAASSMLGVGMLRIGEDFRCFRCSTILPVGHHADPVGELAHDAQVVGDEQHRHAVLGFSSTQQLEDLRLHGDVERRGRLVGDQQFGRWPAPWRSSRAAAGRPKAGADRRQPAFRGSRMPTWSSSSRTCGPRLHLAPDPLVQVRISPTAAPPCAAD
jgi:hypothetical protein